MADAAPPFHRYTITSEGASVGYFRLVEDVEGAWVSWAEVEAFLARGETLAIRRVGDAPLVEDARGVVVGRGFHREQGQGAVSVEDSAVDPHVATETQGGATRVSSSSVSPSQTCALRATPPAPQDDRPRP